MDILDEVKERFLEYLSELEDPDEFSEYRAIAEELGLDKEGVKEMAIAPLKREVGEMVEMIEEFAEKFLDRFPPL